MQTQLFLTSKIREPPPNASLAEAAAAVSEQIDEDLAVLGVDRFDMLMLRDSPSCDVINAQWLAMQDAFKFHRFMPLCRQPPQCFFCSDRISYVRSRLCGL